MASGIDGDWGDLDEVIAHLEGLSEAPARAVAKAAPDVQRIAREDYAANRGPGGTWPRNTSNGRYPSLERPAAAVTFSADGATLVGEGEDVLAYHLGSDRGGNPRLPARAVFPPDGELPPEWEAPIAMALREEIER